MAESSCNSSQPPTLVRAVSRGDYLRRGLWFLLYILAIIALLLDPLKRLIDLSLDLNELYSHIILIPLVSCYLLFSRRKKVFSGVKYSLAAGGSVIIVGFILFLVGRNSIERFEQNVILSLMAFSAVIFCVGGFILFFGVTAARKAAFPLLFLIFMVPIPSMAAECIIKVLQRSSAEVANGLFVLAGVPFIRDGFTFDLPTVSIEVAEQCSGIRSSLVLFIISVLSGHLFLNTGWRKVVLSMAVFPITIIKNGFRIVTLSLLGAYVDTSILSGTLHRKGGIPFFILAMVIFMTILWMLVKNERKREVKFKDASAMQTEESR